MTSSIPTSSISMTSPLKHLAQIKPCGRFLVWVPIRKSEASFLTDQKLSEVASSNGRIWFDLEKLIECGFLSWFWCAESAPKRLMQGEERDERVSPSSEESSPSVRERQTSERGTYEWLGGGDERSRHGFCSVLVIESCTRCSAARRSRSERPAFELAEAVRRCSSAELRALTRKHDRARLHSTIVY